MLLQWDKPQKAMSIDDWKKISADGAPPGTYTPNMTKEDAESWRAELTGTRSPPIRVTIRRQIAGTQFKIVVDEYDHVSLSANGTVHLTFEDWLDFLIAIEEAKNAIHRAVLGNVAKECLKQPITVGELEGRGKGNE